MLFLYAVALSFADRTLDVGTGALILFGAVRATMILAGFIAGHRPRFLEWVGLAGAFAGLVYVVSPCIGAPAPFGSVPMAVAGVAWGICALRGRAVDAPITATAAKDITYRLVVSSNAILGRSGVAIWGRDYPLRIPAETSSG